MLRQIERRPARQPDGAQPARRVEVSLRLVAAELAADVGEDHDRELEPLGLVHGHQANAVGALLENRRLRRLRAIGRLPQLVDEPSEREAALGFVLARELGDLQHVGQHLLAAAPQHEAGVRAGASISRPMVSATGPVVSSRSARAVRRAPRPPAPGARDVVGHIVGTEAVSERVLREQLLFAEREERPAQRGEHRQRVVGPLDGGERGPQRVDLLAFVERLAADEQVRHAARLERLDIRSRHVVLVVDETAEQEAHVAGR